MQCKIFSKKTFESGDYDDYENYDNDNEIIESKQPECYKPPKKRGRK